MSNNTVNTNHHNDDIDNNDNKVVEPSSSPIITDASHDRLTLAWHAIQEKFHVRNWVWFFLLGFINNYHFCVVISGAEAVADLFHLKNLMALISWANIAGGIFVRFLNAFVLMHWSYNKKYLAAGMQTLFGITVVCCAPYCGTSDGFRFFLTLFGILFIGTGSSFGEQTSLGYMNLFPAKTIGAWSSGTGLSGVIGSLVYLGLQNADLNEPSIFAIQLPFVFVYWACYYFGVVLVPRNEVTLLDEEAEYSSVNNNNNTNDENEGDENEEAPKATFKQIPNAQRTWKDEAKSGASSNASSNASSTKSQLEMKTEQNFSSSDNIADQEQEREDQKKTEKRPLLQSNNNNEDDEDGESRNTNNNSTNNDNAGNNNNNNATIVERFGPPDPSITPVGENPEWGSFRRWLFRTAPVFPAEAIVECNKLILFQGINLFLVYVFEYSVQFVAPDCFPDFSKDKNTGGAPPPGNNFSTTTFTTMLPSNYSTTTSAAPPASCPAPKESFDFLTKNAFVVSQFCYQFGVLISRSSLSVVRIKRVELLTLLQFINFICWIVLAKTEWLIDTCDPDKQLKYTIIMMVWMILVGLQGGASYVNVFFNILNDSDLQLQLALISKGELARQKERKRLEEKRLGAEQPHLAPFKLNARELTMNVSALYQTLGITIGSILDVILNNTLIKNR